MMPLAAIGAYVGGAVIGKSAPVDGGDRPTDQYIDSQIDSQEYYNNKKAHRIMGLVAVTGGDAGIRTLDPGFAQMHP